MAKRKRLRDKKQQGMNRRLTGGKKPMSPEQKKQQKILREKQSEIQKKLNEKKK
ncbi:hypothetical protein J4411_03100 [Candidatus Pacearchaeota archaeon]|nr:hypothetical protein [Candidatus Pacearchaeota archaeon]